MRASRGGRSAACVSSVVHDRRQGFAILQVSAAETDLNHGPPFFSALYLFAVGVSDCRLHEIGLTKFIHSLLGAPARCPF